MINFLNIDNSKPYKVFLDHYDNALYKNQRSIEAICISSFNKSLNEVSSRFVNLKYIQESEWIFFSNYNSPKSKDFGEHKQISAVIYWESINLQIRIKANITKTNSDFSDQHFNMRGRKKNSLAISSNQSLKIDSYSKIEKNYIDVLESEKDLHRPDYWGGFSFTPYYFEFWEGEKFRLNKRNVYMLKRDTWESCILQP